MASPHGLRTSPQKRGIKDWNELHIRESISPEIIAEAQFHGSLLIAKTAQEKADLIYTKYDNRFFCMEFKNRTYGVSIKPKEEGGYVIETAEIANFAIEFQYFKRNEVTDESWYSSLIRFPHKGGSVRCDFTGGQISSAPEFKKRCMSVAPGAVFTGSSSHLNWLSRNHLYQIKVVETIDFLGYSKEHEAYIYDKHAFHRGRVYEINADKYFQIGNRSVTSIQKSINIDIGGLKEYDDTWINDIWNAYGVKGIVALSYWVGTLYAEQIRDKQSSFPFLEIVGLPDSGKSTLVEFLWRLFGREGEEGSDPSKNTAAATARKFGQLSGMPIVMIEADRDVETAKGRKFDWEETKPLYNGRGMRSTGVKNSGNETYDPPFRGAITVVQNDSVKASPAVMQRFLHLEISQEGYTPESKVAADKLSLTKLKNLSRFLSQCLTNEEKVLASYLKAFPSYEEKLLGLEEIKTQRIAKTHAQLMAMAQSVFGLINLDDEKSQLVRDEIKMMAIQRQQAIGGDHPVVEKFWEIFDYLESTREGGGVVNHARAIDKISINLNHFFKIASEYRQDTPSMDQLKKHLRDSKSRKFLSYKNVNSKIPRRNDEGHIDSSLPDAVLKCFVFSNPRHNETAHG